MHLRKFLIPYLDRLEELESGARESLLQNYLLHCSATCLRLPLEVIKHSCSISDPLQLFNSTDECVNIGLDCIYTYEPSPEDEDSAEIIGDMAQFLKKKCRNQMVLEEIDDILDIMRAVRLLRRYNIQKTLHYFKVCKDFIFRHIKFPLL